MLWVQLKCMYPASRSNFPCNRPSSTFHLYFLFLSVLGAPSWLRQFLDVSLLNMRHVLLGNQLVDCLSVSCPNHSNTTFAERCSVILFQINSYVDSQRRSGTQSKFLDNDTSKRNSRGKNYGSACRVNCMQQSQFTAFGQTCSNEVGVSCLFTSDSLTGNL